MFIFDLLNKGVQFFKDVLKLMKIIKTFKRTINT